MQRKKIDSSILLASSASIIDQVDLRNDAAISRWHIGNGSVSYEKADSHTLSLYVKGGTSSFRRDKAGEKGAPGRLCLMPQGHRSQWAINDTIDFVHLYFSDRLLKEFAALHFDCDVRFIELQDLTYEEDEGLQELIKTYYRTVQKKGESAYIWGEETLYKIFDHLIRSYNAFKVKGGRVAGGLSPANIRRVKACISEQISANLSIATLSKELGLSPYHFARMFKISLGETPAQFISRVRVEKAKQLLKSEAAIAEISAATGFAQQSHMTQHFKKQVGVTPNVYRATQCS